MNRRERRNKQRQEKRVLKGAQKQWVATLKRPCRACRAAPSWQIVQRGSDVWYQCASCGADAFRIPFNTDALAAEFVRRNQLAEAAS